MSPASAGGGDAPGWRGKAAAAGAGGGVGEDEAVLDPRRPRRDLGVREEALHDGRVLVAVAHHLSLTPCRCERRLLPLLEQNLPRARREPRGALCVKQGRLGSAKQLCRVQKVTSKCILLLTGPCDED